MSREVESLKYIHLVRHGEPDNPKKIVYNLDEVMKEEDVIHITNYGRHQLRALGNVIKKLGFEVVRIRYSDQVRAVESVQALNIALQVKDIRAEPRLKDVYAPGAYLEGLSMHEWREQKGDAYDQVRWKKYSHESPESVIERFNSVFQETASNLEADQTAILLSHGDPIAWFTNFKVSGKIPNSKKLRSLIYPVQGQAIVVVLDSENNIVKHYLLRDPGLLKGKSY